MGQRQRGLGPGLKLQLPQDVRHMGFHDSVDGFYHYPATYHNGGAVVSFVDGHAEAHKWTDPRTERRARSNQLILHNESSPNNADLRWIQERTTGRGAGGFSVAN